MFQDRADAGRRLAQRLARLAAEDCVVLGLPRGGVVVAAEIARALNAPLDVLVVRKLGAPDRPELAIGAITDGDEPQRVMNEDVIRLLGVDDQYIESEARRQLADVHARQERYRRGRTAVPIADRTAIVTDDGIATGATMRAGLVALSRTRVRRLVLAVPVAPPETLRMLSHQVDETVCLTTPVQLGAVGAFYRDFSQTPDVDVINLLAELGGEPTG